MAPRLAVIMLLLVVVAGRGTAFFRYRVWNVEQFRMIMITLLIMLLIQKIHINLILTRKWNNCTRSGSAAMVLMAMGLQLLVAGFILTAASFLRIIVKQDIVF